MSQTTLFKPLPFRVFYCPELPLAAINHDQSEKGWRRGLRLALAEDISKAGLINPLIVLNHPRPKCPGMWLMVGQNRLWALKYLGWTHAPAVVTGTCPEAARELVTWDDLRLCFQDGEPVPAPYGLAMVGNAPLESYL